MKTLFINSSKEKKKTNNILVKQLFKNALLAIICPYKAYKKIPNDKRINYKIVVPLMLLIGFISSYLHLRISYDLDSTRYPLLIMVSYHSLWGLIYFWAGSFLAFFVANLFKRKIKLEEIEIAFFYIWTGWAILPLFSALKYLVDWTPWTIQRESPLSGSYITLTGHLGLYFIIPFIIFSLYFFLKDTLKFKKKRELLPVFLFFVFSIFLARFSGQATINENFSFFFFKPYIVIADWLYFNSLTLFFVTIILCIILFLIRKQIIKQIPPLTTFIRKKFRKNKIRS